ncbi:hypothetical protein ABT024_07195 [Streptomyces sp. NPDC002812]|uniref:hypothetical protein n=1 Tax=Streptomyces sp. NPDC002812 TaxID=3154434 RepID=UPI00332CBB5F
MNNKARKARAAAIAASSSLAAGATVLAYGLYIDDLTPAVGGVGVTITSSVLLALVKIRVWTTDTRAERTRLAEATQQAEDERTRYIALAAASDAESTRIRRDAAAERQENLVRLRAERAAMEEDFAGREATRQCEALDAAFHMIRRGVLNAPAQPETHARVIELPGLARQRQARPAAAPARDREAYRP